MKRNCCQIIRARYESDSELVGTSFQNKLVCVESERDMRECTKTHNEKMPAENVVIDQTYYVPSGAR